MELRHLRYFVAVAENGSLLSAAKHRLNTSQPSLSRQIRDLETEVGATLLIRHARGISLTEAGQIFLQHARAALAQVDAATEGARRLSKADRPMFAVGFIAGHEAWLPSIVRTLRGATPDVDIKLSSQSSPLLAEEISRGSLDIGIMRREPLTGLSYVPLAREPLLVMMSANHHLAEYALIDPLELERQIYVGSATASPVVDAIARSHAAKTGFELRPQFDAGSLSSAVSMVLATGGLTLVPSYAKEIIPHDVLLRPLLGEQPMIELLLGSSEANEAPLLKHLIAHADKLGLV